MYLLDVSLHVLLSQDAKTVISIYLSFEFYKFGDLGMTQLNHNNFDSFFGCSEIRVIQINYMK